MQTSPMPGDEHALTAQNQAALRRLRRGNLIVLLGGVAELALNFIQNPPLPIVIAKLIIMVILVVVIGTTAIRFSLWQRDEYWREGGRDPKDPERLSKDMPGGTEN